jgi:hypothetical protein
VVCAAPGHEVAVATPCVFPQAFSRRESTSACRHPGARVYRYDYPVIVFAWQGYTPLREMDSRQALCHPYPVSPPGRPSLRCVLDVPMSWIMATTNM